MTRGVATLEGEVRQTCVVERGSEEAELLEARAAFYEMLASLYFKPLTQEQIDAMAAADFSVYAQLNEECAEGAEDMLRYLSRRNSDTRRALAVDFTGAFAGTSAYEGKVAVPFESVFTSEEGLMYRDAYVEVFTTLKSEQVKRREGLDWPDDHLSFMFDFLAILSRRAKSRLLECDVAQARHNIEVSRDFMDAHILSWFEDFAALAGKILETRFYHGVIKVTRGFLAFDRGLADELLVGWVS